MATYIRGDLKFNLIEAEFKAMANIELETYTIDRHGIGIYFIVTTFRGGVVVVSGNRQTAVSHDNGSTFTMEGKTIRIPDKEDGYDATLIHAYNLTSLIKAML